MQASLTLTLWASLVCLSFSADNLKPLLPQQKVALDARAILANHCGQCHGVGGANRKALFLDFKALLKDGHIVKGHPEESELYTIIAEGDMPPDGGGTPVSKKDLAIIKKWIEDFQNMIIPINDS